MPETKQRPRALHHDDAASAPGGARPRVRGRARAVVLLCALAVVGATATAARAQTEAGDDDAGDVDDGSLAYSDASPDQGASDAGAVGVFDADSASPQPRDAAASDAKAPYDAGDGLTPLAELPTWSLQEDHNGCSCALGGPSGGVVAGSAWFLGALLVARRRRLSRG